VDKITYYFITCVPFGALAKISITTMVDSRKFKGTIEMIPLLITSMTWRRLER